jgi:3-oxoacyl-[acyl-carrier protein] reductase
MPRLTKLSRSIAGRTALVTGAASGMGRATAQLFADEGARVAVVDRDEPGVARVVDEIAKASRVAAGFALDVGDTPKLSELARQVREQLGPIDILINNAGIVAGGPIDAADFPVQWERALAINLSAQVHLIRACLDQLTRNGDGRIVNIASTEGLGAGAFLSPYTASKHGVVGLTRALAVELGAKGVTVNCICPGPIHTGMTAVIADEAKQKFARRRVPARRYGDPEEVAQMTLSLVLPAASYVNGAIVPVDGGLIAQNT